MTGVGVGLTAAWTIIARHANERINVKGGGGGGGGKCSKTTRCTYCREGLARSWKRATTIMGRNEKT